MNRPGVVAAGVESESHVAIRFGVLRIHAEGGTRFRDGVHFIAGTVETVGQPVVDLEESGSTRFRLLVLVAGFIPILLLLAKKTQREVEGGVVGIVGD